MLRKNAWLLPVLPLSLVLMAGCGSGGSSSGGTAVTGSRAAVDLYVTDGFSDAYKQVLVTLYKIELTTDGTNYTTVYTSDTGQTLDLATMGSTAELLASVNIPEGTYTAARITFGDHFTLVTPAGVSTSVAVDPTVGTQSNGQVSLVVATPTKVQSNQNNAVFVDFKLAEFQLVGNVLRPSVHCGTGDSDQQNKARTSHLQGTVTNLTGTTSFTLQGENGRTVNVLINDATTITSELTGADVTLANGQQVDVKGTYDPTTSTVTATSVTLDDESDHRRIEAKGTVKSVDTAAGTFVLTVDRAEGIHPTGGTITVATNSSTKFAKGRHDMGSLANVTAGAKVEVGGTFDAATQTLTARMVAFHP